jgi:hypothetical protein
MLAVASATAAEPDWQTKFDLTYRLADKENAKFIPAPFIPERAAFHKKQHPYVQGIPGQYGFAWDGKRVQQRRWSSDPGTVASAMEIAGVERVDLGGVSDLFDLKIAGDWIVRKDAPKKDVVKDVSRILEKVSEGKVHIEPVEIEKDVLVARGKYELKKLHDPPAPRQPDNVHLYVDKLDAEEGAGGGTGTMLEFLERIGELAKIKVVDETGSRKAKVSWSNNHSAGDASKTPQNRERFLKNVTAQTGLEFRTERRKTQAFKVTDPTGKSGGL